MINEKATGAVDKPDLLSWEDASSLGWDEIQEIYRDHLNPGYLQILKLLGYNKIRVVSAENVHYVDANGKRILDCWGGFGSLNVGHNHPRLLEVRRRFDETKQVEICHAFIQGHAAVLARNLASLMPEGLDFCYLCCAGSEAVEGALKLAEKYKKNNRGTIIYAEKAMHGKTHGALSVTGHEPFRKPFKLLSGCVSIPFGNAAALREMFESRGGKNPEDDIIAVVLESIQCGGGIIIPPDGYLGEVERLCRRYGALLIIDEVQTGFGRTGRMFAFEHEDVTPDIVTVSKSFGGGKAPIAAYVAKKEIFEKAYGSTRDCLLHSSTFSGMGGACALATEAIHILYDERLIERAAVVGGYFIERMRELHSRYPDFIIDVRGRGLLMGVEFRNMLELLTGGLAAYLPKVKRLGRGALVALIANRLLFDYQILTAFTEFNRNVMRFEPPLTIEERHVDTVISALDEILSKGAVSLVTNAMKSKLFDRW